MATLEEQNFLCAMQGSQKELSRATNSPFVAGLPFLYDFLRDEGWLELARKELFKNGVQAHLLRTLVKACWPSVTPDESEFYGHTRLCENTELTKLKLHPNEPVTMLYTLELVLLAMGWPYRISETPSKEDSNTRDTGAPKLVQLLDQLTGDKLKSVYVTAVQAIENTGKLKQPKHLQCMVENLAMVVFGLYWYTTASLCALAVAPDTNEWLKSLKSSVSQTHTTSTFLVPNGQTSTPDSAQTVYDQSILPRRLVSYPVSSGSWNLVQFCLGSKPKAMVMVDQLFYKGLYDFLEKTKWSPHHYAHGQHHQTPVSPQDHNQAQTLSHLAGSESQSHAKDN
ncbi:hypothetical protein GGX14DRAFT_389340 [Mycena pura]|uniref:Uncharacterized protein n=1 Tax=Mycena pura TaxID=153505 RepID=A0AAD6YIK2_9AGAR|nr:hypothetical protein GGX14DRAFT_389340 [Mycena pura]